MIAPRKKRKMKILNSVHSKNVMRMKKESENIYVTKHHPCD